MRIHRAIRILQADRRGSSLPVIIEPEAGLFFTKLRGAAQGTSALVAEIIVAALAEALGLRVPQRVLINIDDTTVSEDRNDELADLLAASRGCNLGFEWLEAAADLQPEDLPGIDRETASKILWLDGLVMNPDRTAQNPNLLMRGEHLWLIDHGAALGFYHNWSSVTEDSPARVLATMSRHVMREHATDLARLDDVLAQRLNRDVIRSAVEQVPDDFLRPLLPKPISRTLSRRREAYCAFLWKRLKKPRRFATNMDSLETVADFAQETTGVPPDWLLETVRTVDLGGLDFALNSPSPAR